MPPPHMLVGQKGRERALEGRGWTGGNRAGGAGLGGCGRVGRTGQDAAWKEFSGVSVSKIIMQMMNPSCS